MVTVSNEDKVSRISLEGRIDSANAPEIEKQIFDRMDSSADKIIIDAENLEFISSAEGIYDSSTHTVTYNIDSLLAGDKKTFILTVKINENVKEDTYIGNVALVLGDDGEDVPSNEVITKIEVPPTDEVFENPETSDDISLILLTGILNTMMFGYLITRKRLRNA